MKLFILPNQDRDGIYYLITEDGEVLASHWCSGRYFAKGDLEGHRPERQKEYKKRFGEYTVQFLDEQQEITQKELEKRNKNWYDSLPENQKEKS